MTIRVKSRVLAPGEHKGTTEKGVVEKRLRNGKIRVVFEDNSFGDFKPESLKPYRSATREDRKVARDTSRQAQRRSKLTPEEQDKAIAVFNELSGHKVPTKDVPQVGDVVKGDMLAYSNALGVMRINPAMRELVQRVTAKVFRGLSEGKVAYIGHEGKLYWYKGSTFDAYVEKLRGLNKAPRYVLTTLPPDEAVRRIVVAVATN